MLKFLRSFALTALLLLPFVTQAQDSWTVADGTTTHAMVPLDFYNCDGSGVRQAQMLYPASLLTDMEGSSIGSITFYHQNTGSKTVTASPWLIKMGTTTLSDLSEGLSSDELTTVYTGNLVITSGVMTFEFSTPYTYSGGNLIVEIYTTGASGNWYGSSNQGCYGTDNVGSTYSTMSSPNYTAFLPKTTFTEAPSCYPVTSLAIDAAQTTTSSLTLTWTSDATSFVVFDTTDADNSYTVSTNTYTFDNLDANTEYTFGVYVDCGAGDVSDTLYVTGRTACGAIASVPWSDGMEAVPAGSNQMPFCWTRYNNLTSGNNYYPYSYSYSSYAHEGNRSLYFYYSTYGTYADTAIAILPQIDENSLTLSDLQLTLWARSNTAIDVLVGTMSDPADPTTFVVEDTVTVDGTTYTRFDVNLDDAPVTNTYAAIMVLNPSVYVSLYIDDVSLQEIPSCAYVTNLTVENITAEGATLSWHGDADGYTIYNMADATVEGTATETTYTLTDLTANTEYTFGVAANCGSDESEIINVTFRTACGAVELPYTETFASTSTTRDCWNLVSNNTANVGGSNMGFVTYSGHDVMCFSSWSNASDYNQYGYSPVLDASGLTEADSIHVRVVYSSYSEDDPLYFGYTTAASTTPTDYTWVGPFYTDGYDAWASLEANLPLDVVQLAVHYASTGCNYRAYVDSVEVTGYVIPSCPAPTGLAASNITAEGATLTWNGEATGYTVYDMTDTSVVGTATEATYALTDLTANTQYTYGVAAICGSDESEIINVTFRTACSAVAIPFTEDFENGIYCWTMVSTATNTGVAANSSYTTVAYSGTHAFKFAYNTNPPQYLISPELSGTEDGVKVSFMYKAGGSYSESFALGYSTTTNDVTAFTWNTEVTGITNNEFETYSAILPVDVKYVSVKYTANNQLALYIDSMVFEEAPACLPVAELAVDTATENSITISWTGTAASYSVYYGSTFVENVTDNSYTFTGLTAATGYTFGVVAVCSETDSAEMVTINASTACLSTAINLPFNETFNLTSGSRNCWTTIDADGDGFNWTTQEDGTGADQEMMLSYSYDNGSYEALNPDNWLISPKLHSNTGSTVTLQWTVASASSYPAEHYGVYVSTTTTDTVAFTMINEWTMTSGTQEVKTLDLSAYAGQDFYVAFRHHNCTDMYVLMIDDVQVYEGVYVPDTLMVTFEVNDTTMGTTIPAPGTYAYAETDTLFFGSQANSGNRFLQWIITYDGAEADTLGSDYANGYFMPVIALMEYDTVVFRAEFEAGNPDSTTITYAVNDATMGTTTPAPGTYTIYVGNSIEVEATANTGYVFDFWTIETYVGTTSYGTDTIYDMNPLNAGTLPQQFADYGATLTITAHFAVDSVPPVVVPTYTVTVNVNDTAMGTVTGAPTAPVDSASAVVLTATANEGYHFVNWTDASAAVLGTSATLNLTVTADMTITANFEANAVGVTHIVTVNVNDETMGTATGTGEYADGETAVLVATANDGYHFVSWSNGETTDTIRVVVLSDTTLTATFAEDVNVYTVTVYYDETMGTVTGAGEYEEGATATLTATANEGYVFTGWSNGETDSIITITVTENVTLTANFAAVTGIEEVEGAEAVVYATDNKIVVKGAEGMSIYVFDVNGRVMSREANAAEQTEFVMPATGIYLVKVGEAAAKRVVVMR